MPNPTMQSRHDLEGILARHRASPTGRRYFYHKFAHELHDAIDELIREKTDAPNLWQEIAAAEIETFIANQISRIERRSIAESIPTPRASELHPRGAPEADHSSLWSNSQRPKLSILVPSMHTRAAHLAALLKNVAGQAARADEEVEILVDMDGGVDRSAVTTGQKRNRLIARSSGEYVVFIDDDDTVHKEYVSLILAALAKQPGVDCVAIHGVMIRVDHAGRPEWRFHHSIRYTQWRDALDAKDRHERCPNQLNPIRRDLVLQVPFPHTNVEDRPWSEKLRPLLKTEVEIETPIYTYNARS